MMKDGWGLVVPEDMYQGQEGRDQKHRGQEYQGHHCDDTGSQTHGSKGQHPSITNSSLGYHESVQQLYKKTMIEIL